MTGQYIFWQSQLMQDVGRVTGQVMYWHNWRAIYKTRHKLSLIFCYDLLR